VRFSLRAKSREQKSISRFERILPHKVETSDFARHFFLRQDIHCGCKHGAIQMTCKFFIAAGLLVVLFLFFPHGAHAAEQSGHTEKIILHPAQSVSMPASTATLTHLEITRSRDSFERIPPSLAAVPFDQMWTLILKYQQLHNSHFSPELIACLFWEESGFRMVEHPLSHAAGFGQVLPSTLRAINKRYGTAFTTRDMLTSPEASVEAAILALELAWDWKRDKAGALAAYAGGSSNQHIVHKWLAAEAAMQNGRIPYGRSFGMQTIIEQHQIRALRLCSQPGFDPQVIFD
jgi:hypothetical protein